MELQRSKIHQRDNSHKSEMQKLWKKVNKEHGALKFDRLFQDYITDVEKVTNRKIPENQMKLIIEHMEKHEYVKLDTSESKNHRKEFNGRKHKLLDEWEKNTSQKWPRYTEPLRNQSGKMVRPVGAPYDFHHVIECSWGGNSEWWNMHPAKNIYEHQNGIHRRGGYAERIFN